MRAVPNGSVSPDAEARNKKEDRSMRKMRLVQLFILPATVMFGAVDKEITLCDLVDHKAFDGKHVVISGRMTFSMHGTTFLPEPCKNSPPGVAVLLPNVERNPRVNYEADPQTLQRLSPFFHLQGGATTACGALSGQLLYRKAFHLRRAGAGPIRKWLWFKRSSPLGTRGPIGTGHSLMRAETLTR